MYMEAKQIIAIFEDTSVSPKMAAEAIMKEYFRIKKTAIGKRAVKDWSPSLTEMERRLTENLSGSWYTHYVNEYPIDNLLKLYRLVGSKPSRNNSGMYEMLRFLSSLQEVGDIFTAERKYPNKKKR